MSNLKEFNTVVKKGKIELHKSSFTGREWRVLQRIFDTTPDCVAIKIEGNLNIAKIDKEDFPKNYKDILATDAATRTFDVDNIKQFIISKGGEIEISQLYYSPMYRPTVENIKTLNNIINIVSDINSKEPHETILAFNSEEDILNIGYFIFSCVTREIPWRFIMMNSTTKQQMIFDINPFKYEYKLCVNKGMLSVKVDVISTK